MSTCATIVIEIPKNKKGKTYEFGLNDKFEFSTPNTVIPQDANYVSVYHHFDGDILGKTLLEYNDFDTIMSELICGGDMSFIGRPYHGWRNEDWKYVQPKFTEAKPEPFIYYTYYFNLDKKWECSKI